MLINRYIYRKGLQGDIFSIILHINQEGVKTQQKKVVSQIRYVNSYLRAGPVFRSLPLPVLYRIFLHVSKTSFIFTVLSAILPGKATEHIRQAGVRTSGPPLSVFPVWAGNGVGKISGGKGAFGMDILAMWVQNDQRLFFPAWIKGPLHKNHQELFKYG